MQGRVNNLNSRAESQSHFWMCDDEAVLQVMPCVSSASLAKPSISDAVQKMLKTFILPLARPQTFGPARLCLYQPGRSLWAVLWSCRASPPWGVSSQGCTAHTEMLCDLLQPQQPALSKTFVAPANTAHFWLQEDQEHRAILSGMVMLSSCNLFWQHSYLQRVCLTVPQAYIWQGKEIFLCC